MWLAGGALACGGQDVAAPVEKPAVVPRLASATVASNPYNALSAVVAFSATNADSARVIILPDQGPVDSTPYAPITGATDTIVTLGLRPSTGYRHILEIAGPDGTGPADTLSLRTGPLPDALQRITISSAGQAGPGLTLTALELGEEIFALAFDSSGTIRWYRAFDGPGRGDVKQQTNGNFTLYRGGSTGVEPASGHYIEFTPAGDSVRAISVAPPHYLDNHELWITTAPDGRERFHCFTYERRTVDLTGIGGGSATSLAGHQLVRLRSDGSSEFEWNAWDQVSLNEWIEPPRPEPGDSAGRDFDHPNSIDIDREGNYIVSFRRLGQVMKIDGFTGNVLWRLGGRRNQFTFLNDPFGGFGSQHSARVLPNGHLLLYDNGSLHRSPESRVVEYALDTVHMTATLVWEFRHVPPIYTPGLGLVQRLGDGSTFIGYGQLGRASEVGQDGRVRWEAEVRNDGDRAVLYRLMRIGSLYRFMEP
jgi:arylsulfotransferase ASST